MTTSRGNRPVEPDGQGAGGGSPTPEPSLDDVVYIAVVRSSNPRSGAEVMRNARATGLSYAEIARIAGLSASTVRRMVG